MSDDKPIPALSIEALTPLFDACAGLLGFGTAFMRKVVSRQTQFEPALARSMVQACAQGCRLCGEECEQHGQHGMEHCRVCAEACRRCEESCNRLLSMLPA